MGQALLTRGTSFQAYQTIMSLTADTAADDELLAYFTHDREVDVCGERLWTMFVWVLTIVGYFHGIVFIIAIIETLGYDGLIMMFIFGILLPMALIVLIFHAMQWLGYDIEPWFQIPPHPQNFVLDHDVVFVGDYHPFDSHRANARRRNMVQDITQGA